MNKKIFNFCFILCASFLLTACSNKFLWLSNATELSDQTNLNKKIKQPIIHSAHLSNSWYPQDKNLLNQELDFYFDLAQKNFKISAKPESVKILIAPHAGIYFSALCAASVYQTLQKTVRPELVEGYERCKNTNINKVIILCPSHTKYFSGLALPDYDIYKTTLGEIKVNNTSITKLKQNNLFKIFPETHSQEHAIEIQLPFLQKTIKDFEIVPLIVGEIAEQDYEIIAQNLDDIIDNSTLIVVSSDFTHYGPNYNYIPFKQDILRSIRFVDSLALNSINKKSFAEFNKIISDTGVTICGQNAIKIILKLLENQKYKNLQSRLACYSISPQLEQARLKQDKNTLNFNSIKINKLYKNIPDNLIQNSVSYLGAIFTSQDLNSLPKENMLTQYEKNALLASARDTLQNSFKPPAQKSPDYYLWPICGLGLQQNSGIFVTLNTKSGDLRGCIGRIISQEPLLKTAVDVSLESAFHDTRFLPLKKEELDNIIINISILTPPDPIDSYKKIRIGIDGIILKKGWASSVFLPQVAPSFNWDLKTTLEQLSLKAGLDKDAWQHDCNFEVFQGFEIKE
ncbi:AmmeMemoRadiSam system protein B [Candidatus Babeliales bacterium]|nr:AmmeMemoRadiSam system protein B [Candidatus Babeliales bacterium]